MVTLYERMMRMVTTTEMIRNIEKGIKDFEVKVSQITLRECDKHGPAADPSLMTYMYIINPPHNILDDLKTYYRRGREWVPWMMFWVPVKKSVGWTKAIWILWHRCCEARCSLNPPPARQYGVVSATSTRSNKSMLVSSCKESACWCCCWTIYVGGEDAMVSNLYARRMPDWCLISSWNFRTVKSTAREIRSPSYTNHFSKDDDSASVWQSQLSIIIRVNVWLQPWEMSLRPPLAHHQTLQRWSEQSIRVRVFRIKGTRRGHYSRK